MAYRLQILPPFCEVIIGSMDVYVEDGVISCDMGASDIEIVASEREEGALTIRGRIGIHAPGWPMYQTDGDDLWLPWYAEAVIVGALAPRILEHLARDEGEDDDG